MTTAKRILIAGDDEPLADSLAARCRSLGLAVDRAADVMTALRRIDQGPPDMLILEVDVPETIGRKVCETIARNPELKSIPVVFLTGGKNSQKFCDGHSLQADFVPKGPNMWLEIKPLVSALLRQGPRRPAETQNNHSPPHGDEPPAVVKSGDSPEFTRSECIDAVFDAFGWDDPSPDIAPRERVTEVLVTRPWVLCIDDDPGFAAVMKLRLERHGVEVMQAFAGMAGYRYAFTTQAQAIILDYELPDGNGDYILGRLKANPATKDIPVIVLTGRNDRALERKMYNLGAARFFTKPVAWETLWGELRKHIGSPAMPASV